MARPRIRPGPGRASRGASAIRRPVRDALAHRNPPGVAGGAGRQDSRTDAPGRGDSDRAGRPVAGAYPALPIRSSAQLRVAWCGPGGTQIRLPEGAAGEPKGGNCAPESSGLITDGDFACSLGPPDRAGKSIPTGPPVRSCGRPGRARGGLRHAGDRHLDRGIAGPAPTESLVIPIKGRAGTVPRPPCPGHRNRDVRWTARNRWRQSLRRRAALGSRIRPPRLSRTHRQRNGTAWRAGGRRLAGGGAVRS